MSCYPDPFFFPSSADVRKWAPFRPYRLGRNHRRDGQPRHRLYVGRSSGLCNDRLYCEDWLAAGGGQTDAPAAAGPANCEYSALVKIGGSML